MVPRWSWTLFVLFCTEDSLVTTFSHCAPPYNNWLGFSLRKLKQIELLFLASLCTWIECRANNCTEFNRSIRQHVVTVSPSTQYCCTISPKSAQTREYSQEVDVERIHFPTYCSPPRAGRRPRSTVVYHWKGRRWWNTNAISTGSIVSEGEGGSSGTGTQ